MAFILLEWLVLMLKGKPLPLLGDTFASGAMIVIMECARILTRGVEHTAYIYIHQHYRLIDLPWQSTFTWYFAAVFVDFCYYWGHRATHEINVLWAHHQAHHSAESYTLVNTLRLPFTQEWLFSFAYLPMALFISPAHYLVHLQLNLLYQFWLHTEIIGKLGPFEWIFNTPSHHRVHHGSNKFCLDKNYGAWLIVWDRMFGTFQEEKDDEEIVYGLVDQAKSFNPLYLQLYYLRKIFEKFNLMDGWKNKLSSLIKGPGWKPGAPWTGNIDEVPDVRGRKRYEYRALPLWWNVYMSIHSLIALFAYEGVSLFRNRMSPLAVFCHIVYVIFTLTTMGLFYDSNRLAPSIEFFRCIFLLISCNGSIPLLTNCLRWSGLNVLIDESYEIQIYLFLRTYFVLSSIIWGLIIFTQFCKHAYFKQKTKHD